VVSEVLRIAPEISRSWMLVNALNAEQLSAIPESRADQVVIDIEDAVDPSRKDQAREVVLKWLEQGSAWVRVNDANTTYWRDDLIHLSKAPGLLGVMLAKTEDAQSVEQTFKLLGSHLPIIPLVESALGVENAVEIARAKGAFRLAFGSGDYRHDTGASTDDLAMSYPRSRLVVASRIGNLPGPIDGPTVGPNHGQLRQQASLAVSLGLTGKLCLDEKQTVVINDTICPATSDIVWAQEFMADFKAAGSMVRDGSDPPRLKRAEKILNLATSLGVLEAN
jgi:citrate lyase subunit beta / citryl-CoA lyase